MPLAPKYIESVYIIVSDAPIIIDAHIPSKLSAPAFPKSSFTDAVAALPERTLIRITEIRLSGILKRLKRGERREVKTLSAPLAENILTAQIIIIRFGRILKVVEIPSLQPLKNSSVKSFFDVRIHIPASAIITGIVYVPMFINIYLKNLAKALQIMTPNIVVATEHIHIGKIMP